MRRSITLHRPGITWNMLQPLDSEKVKKEKEESHGDDALRRKRRADEFRRTFSVWKFVDPKQPWILVENGSFLGFFDWLPEHFRMGPWSISALALLFTIAYLILLAGVYFTTSHSQPWFHNSDIYHGSVVDMYPDAWSSPWCYHSFGLLWMIFIIYVIYTGPTGPRAWCTYTVQSWTLLTFRHGLCVLAPWSSTAASLAEWIRFPAACSATVTFFVWNFAVFPSVYLFFLKDPEHKRNFFNFCTSFRMLNIHFANIGLAAINCGPWASPRRRLVWMDLYVSMVSILIYMGLYLLIFDRLGIHMYPLFSPRTSMVLPAWTSLLGVYLVTFYAWRWIVDIV